MFDVGAQIYATGQGLIQQLNHVPPDFQRDLEPCGMEALGVVTMAQVVPLRLFRSSDLRVRPLGLEPPVEWGGPETDEALFHSCCRNVLQASSAVCEIRARNVEILRQSSRWGVPTHPPRVPHAAHYARRVWSR
jgi:hypothetical protein